MFLLDDIFFWIPIKSLIKIAEIAKELAEQDIFDITSLQEELLEYEVLFQTKKISFQKYQQKEQEISEKILKILANSE